MRHALPAMLARGEGGIINVASLGGLVPGPNQAAYYASKAYVVSLTRAVATENAGRGVRLMALAPGPVDTGFHRAMGAELSFYRQLMIALSPEQTARAAYRGYMLGLHLVVPGVTASCCRSRFGSFRTLCCCRSSAGCCTVARKGRGAAHPITKREGVGHGCGSICFVEILFGFSVGRRRESGLAYHGAVGAVARRRVLLNSHCAPPRRPRLPRKKKR